MVSDATVNELTAVTLLERDAERRLLEGALAEAQGERGQLVLIEGAAGLGKTSLLAAVAGAAAERGFICLRARATELERDFPHGCVRQLLEPRLARASGTDRDRLFEGAAAFAAPLFARSAIAEFSPSTDSVFSMLHGLYWLLNNLARDAPVALCVDDLHWSDGESLKFFNYLASRLDGVPLALFASIRARETFSADLVRLCEGPETKLVRLAPLSVEACATFCAGKLGVRATEEFVSGCHGATGGNPLFLEMLLREVLDLRFLTEVNDVARVRRFGPVAVARTVLARLSSAPPAATALVRAIAVLGDGSRVFEAALFAELSEDDAARAADLLVSLAILKQAEGLEFVHPIVRQAVYADTGFHERARAHARAARILAECGAVEERIATQLVQAEPAGEARRVGLLRRVASEARIRGAPGAAVVWLERALAEPPPTALRAEVLLELGSAELCLASPKAIDHLAAAVHGVRQPELHAFAVRQLANALSLTGSTEQAAHTLESAIASIESHDRELGLILEAEFAAKAQQASREARTRAAARLRRHANLAGATPGERLVLASLAFERARSSESASEAVQHIEPALAAGGWFDERQPDVIGPFYALVIGLLATDAVALAVRHLEHALAEARARASTPAVAFLTAHRGWFLLRRGAVAEAEADARTALELLSVHAIQLGRRFALALLVEALLENGQIDVADQALRDSGMADEVPPGLANNRLLGARGALRVAQGELRAGLEDLIEFGRRDEVSGGSHPLASRWRTRASLALAALGESERARQMASKELERAQRWGAQSGIGTALRAVALVADNIPSIDRLREAADVLQRSPSRLEYARALIDVGAALRRGNRRSEARRTLQEGLALVQRCGAGGLVTRASSELRAAGGRSIDATASGAGRLTVSERRVAELAAKGHSNPSIAQVLFVTRKTVETHLGHIYAKLDISGRAELGRALAAEPASGLG
jgi:DNA-binding CsgD family transcriptional regulator